MPEYEGSRRGKGECCGGHEQGERVHCHGHDHSCGCASHDLAGHRAGCACCHPEEQEHGEENGRREIALTAAGAVLLTAGILLPWEAAGWCVMIAAYLLVGFDIIRQAAENIRHGEVFDENFLMAVASIGAIAIGETPEAVLVMLLYRIGEYLQGRAVASSRRSIRALMDIRPDHANLLRDGQLVETDPEEVSVGETIVVKSGERIPLDGVVTEGFSSLDTAALTGEPAPKEVGPGDAVVSGCINQRGLLQIQVTKAYGESTVARILELVENAGSKKARTENFITRFARYYTPFVVVSALLLALIPPLLSGGQWSQWIQRALIFLVVSCPCALVISGPLSFFGGIGGASRCGILIKGGNYLEALADTDTVVFDKTGTLTQGTFGVSAIYPESISRQELLETAALAESYSDHPISVSLRNAWGQESDPARVSSVEELAGRGVRAVVDGRMVWVGNARLMREAGVAGDLPERSGTVVHVARDGMYAGSIVISDQLKPEAAAVIRELKARGIRRTVMLTGDSREAGEEAAAELGMDQVYAQLLPEDKVDRVEGLLREKSGKGKLAFVGDGINDAPVLSRADLGIAMGAMGSDAAIEAADIVLMDDSLSKIPLAISIAKKTLRIVRQNIVFALSVKALVLLMGAMGAANMWEAVFADVGVSVIAILNAMRALQVKSYGKISH